MFRHYCVILRDRRATPKFLYGNERIRRSLWVQIYRHLFFFVQWPKKAQIFHKLSHCCMFRHCCVYSQGSASNSKISLQKRKNTSVTLAADLSTLIFFILFCTMTEIKHNYFINYHTATCFDTVVSSSGISQSVPCQVTQACQT